MTYPIKPEDFWNLESQQPPEFKFTKNGGRKFSKIDIKFSGKTSGDIEHGWH